MRALVLSVTAPRPMGGAPSCTVAGYQACSVTSVRVEPAGCGPSVDCPRVGTCRAVLVAGGPAAFLRCTPPTDVAPAGGTGSADRGQSVACGIAIGPCPGRDCGRRPSRSGQRFG